MRKFLTLWLLIGIIHSQMPVIDPANLAQNLLTATQTLQSNLNEAEMLNNQIQDLINDAMNL